MRLTTRVYNNRFWSKRQILIIIPCQIILYYFYLYTIFILAASGSLFTRLRYIPVDVKFLWFDYPQAVIQLHIQWTNQASKNINIIVIIIAMLECDIPYRWKIWWFGSLPLLLPNYLHIYIWWSLTEPPNLNLPIFLTLGAHAQGLW